VKGDIVWQEFTVLPPVLAFFIGILSAMLGIGGGELTGPMMLAWKVLPSVSTATTSTMSLLNTTSSVIHYLVLGQVPYDYGALVFGIGAAGGITGRLAAIAVAKRFKRPSIFIFMIIAVLAASYALYIYYLVVEEDDFEFTDFCANTNTR